MHLFNLFLYLYLFLIYQVFNKLQAHVMTSVMSCLSKLRDGIRESVHEPWGFIHFWFLVLLLIPWLVSLGSHRPSNLGTLVPLEEWDYYVTGKCSLFVNCMCSGLLS